MPARQLNNLLPDIWYIIYSCIHSVLICNITELTTSQLQLVSNHETCQRGGKSRYTSRWKKSRKWRGKNCLVFASSINFIEYLPCQGYQDLVRHLLDLFRLPRKHLEKEAAKSLSSGESREALINRLLDESSLIMIDLTGQQDEEDKDLDAVEVVETPEPGQ